MRIIAGKFKNRKILTPKGLDTRPTSGKLREAVFSIIQNSIVGADFLDLFAGSGAMGLEALSRGAGHVVFVDQDRAAFKCVSDNIAQFGLAESVSLVKNDVLRALKNLVKQGKNFDLIYVDPPYGQKAEESPLSQKVLEMIDRENLLKPEGKLLMEESKEVKLDSSSLLHLILEKERHFGRTTLRIYNR